MPDLRRLVLSSCAMLGDAGLAHLRDLQSLRQLHLDGCHGVTSKGIASIDGLQLEELSLRGCDHLDDAVVELLAKMHSLRYLDLRDCLNITAPALARLRKANPDCQVRP
jgi:hypothetical protein